MWRCPECESKRLSVMVEIWAELIQREDGYYVSLTDIEDDLDFPECSIMSCRECEFVAPTVQFKV